MHKVLMNPNLAQLEEVVKMAQQAQTSIRDISIDEIIAGLGRARELWSPNGEYYKKASAYIKEYPYFAPELDLESVGIISELLDKESLIERLKSDFENLRALDSFQEIPPYRGKKYFSPLGIVLHITASNVFLGAIDSIVMGILTKNINVVKLSKDNIAIPVLFYQSLCEAMPFFSEMVHLLCWKGGDAQTEHYLKQEVDAILCWGGEEMVRSYQKDCPLKVKLIEHGPKLSFHLVTKKALEEDADIFQDMARDICLWDQSACANSQHIFLDQDYSTKDFIAKLKNALQDFEHPRRDLTGNEWVEIHKHREILKFRQFSSKQDFIIGKDYMIEVSDSNELGQSHLNRHIVISSIAIDEEFSFLTKYRYYLQTCGLAARGKQRAKLMQKLVHQGVCRITEPGRMLEAVTGSPHDGGYSLLELTRVNCDESTGQMRELLEESEAPYLKEQVSRKLKDYPFMSGELLATHSIDCSDYLLDKRYMQGYIYSSGGTTGRPKFCFYSYEEFNKIARLLAESYKNRGLGRGACVANLFTAGNLWSSFNVIQNALELCGVIQLPIGGLVRAEALAEYVERFKIKTIFGLPSLIVELANQTAGLQIETIFYAGEAFSEEAVALLKKNWAVQNIYSAGYASVDVGPIGHQDASCEGTEHIIFDDLIHLEIVDGEAVVSSKLRKAMPVIRYKTGDKVELVADEQERTKIRLLGRIDKIINIWSSKFTVTDIEQVLVRLLGESCDFQLIVSSKYSRDKLTDQLEIRLQRPIDGELLKREFFEACEDVKNTHAYNYLQDKILVTKNSFEFNERTGKTPVLLDRRNFG